MTIHEKIYALKQELKESGSKQYKAAIQRQLDKLIEKLLSM